MEAGGRTAPAFALSADAVELANALANEMQSQAAWRDTAPVR